MNGPRVLLVEDEGLVAMMVEDMLSDMGCEVAASLARVRDTLEWLEKGEALDGALLDVNLGGGEKVFPVAEALAARHIPFAFTTGYGDVSGSPFPNAPVLGKPMQRRNLALVLKGFGLADPLD